MDNGLICGDAIVNDARNVSTIWKLLTIQIFKRRRHSNGEAIETQKQL